MKARPPRGLRRVAAWGMFALCVGVAAACSASPSGNAGSVENSVAARATVSATAAATWMSQHGYKTDPHLPEFANLVLGFRTTSPEYAAVWDTTGEDQGVVTTVVDDLNMAIAEQKVTGVVVTNGGSQVNLTATSLKSVLAAAKG